MSTSLVQTRPLRLKKAATGVAPKAQDENSMPGKAVAKKPSTSTAAVVKRTAFGEITNVVTTNASLNVKDLKKEALKPKDVVVPGASKKAIVPQKSNFAIGMETDSKPAVTVTLPDPAKIEPVFIELLHAVPMDEDEVHINKDLLLEDDGLDTDFKDEDEDVEDIDSQDYEDPKFCSEYVNEIIDYLFVKEVFIL
jgi:hypothetical protein